MKEMEKIITKLKELIAMYESLGKTRVQYQDGYLDGLKKALSILLAIYEGN